MKQLAKKPKHLPSKKTRPLKDANVLIGDIRALIEKARDHVAQTVDTGLVLLYWTIGQRIHKEILGGHRAAYGEQILPTVSSKLGWSHFVEILTLKENLKRDFYAEMCRIEHWSVRTLRKKIGGMLFERTALSKKPALLAKQELKTLRKEDQMTPDLVFRDPYFLDFLGLKGSYQEKDLEKAILREMESFILELGVGFSFVARQKRMVIGHEDFYLDLLFYHRKLERLVAIELKLDKFKAEFKGQMELYLRWLTKHEAEPNEKAPIGLILCAGKSDEQVELLELEKSGIRVAEYLTELPSRKLLEKKLHDAIQLARERLAVTQRKSEDLTNHIQLHTENKNEDANL